MELVSMVNQKIAKWEERSLQGAASLGKDFRTLVLNFSSNLAMGHPAKGPKRRTINPHPLNTTAMPKLLELHLVSPKHHPRHLSPLTNHHYLRSPRASSYASRRTTLPAKPARTPLWIY